MTEVASGELGAGALSPGPRSSVTVVVPTIRALENIPPLVERLGDVRREAGLDLELLLIDDDSRDGCAELVQRLALPWVRLHVHTSCGGPSLAALDGLRRSRGDVLVVMDADLGHPPEKIPEMLAALERGADAVVGSRLATGATTDGDRRALRRLDGRVATLLAAQLTPLRDPLSGFFAMRRRTFEAGSGFDPIGDQIGLELFVKCRCSRLVEIPIRLADRQRGKSKLTLKERLRHVEHLRRLYAHRYGIWSQLVQFLLVGASGLVVNLALLTVFLAVRAPDRLAVALAILLSMVWNFFLNRRFSFSHARGEPMLPQLARFLAACSVGAGVNFVVTSALWGAYREQLAAAFGVAAGTAFNFVSSRLVVFVRATAAASGARDRRGPAGSPPPAPAIPVAGGRRGR